MRRVLPPAPPVRRMPGITSVLGALRRLTATRRIFVAGFMSSVLALTGLGLASSACAARSTVALPRAMWVWYFSSPSNVMSWATGHFVNELYVYVDGTSFSGTKLTQLQDLK